MKERYEILEHTADIGLRAFGGSLAEVYENAAYGMLRLIAAPEKVRPLTEETVEVEGADAVDLLVAWLHEVLFRFDAHKFLCAEVRVEEVSERRLRATLRGERLDLSRHEMGIEIKAVTYHAAKVERTEGGWMAEVLFDV